MMRILTTAIVLSTVLSSSLAQSLGATFLTVAKNYTQSSSGGGGGVTTLSETRSSTYSLEMKTASAIRPLATKIDNLCAKHNGTVSSQSQSGNATFTTSYSLGCRFTTDKYKDYESAVKDLLETARNDTTSYNYYTDSYVDSFSSYSSSTNPSLLLAQQKALEGLMAKAETIEEVMLVFSSLQYIVTGDDVSYPPPTTTNTITVSLTQTYTDSYPYPSLPFPRSISSNNND